MELTINTDGGSRGNPGDAACAFVVQNTNGVYYQNFYYLGIQTNNVAEYMGLIKSLEYLLDCKEKINIESVTIKMDSELVVKQMNGVYKVRDSKMQELQKKAKELIVKSNIKIVIVSVPRNQNSEADKLVNQCLDSQQPS